MIQLCAVHSHSSTHIIHCINKTWIFTLSWFHRNLTILYFVDRMKKKNVDNQCNLEFCTKVQYWSSCLAIGSVCEVATRQILCRYYPCMKVWFRLGGVLFLCCLRLNILYKFKSKYVYACVLALKYLWINILTLSCVPD